MNVEALRKSLIKHEGVRNLPYEDSEGELTIGIGHLLSRPISKLAIEQIFQDDLAEAISELDRAFLSWRNHDDARQNVLVEMMFNLGAPRLAKFVRMWDALAKKDYAAASAEMLNSAWHVQVGQRAKTLAEVMKYGK